MTIKIYIWGAFAMGLLGVMGCTTKLTSSEQALFYSKTVTKGDLRGTISVDASEIGPLMTRGSQIKRNIQNAIERDGHQAIEEDNGTSFIFHFDDCVEQPEYHPTKYVALNLAIHIGTLFLWPIGQDSICKGTLTVSNSKGASEPKTYSSQVNCIYQGHLFLYISPVRFPPQYGVKELLARKLIGEYQIDLAKNSK